MMRLGILILIEELHNGCGNFYFLVLVTSLWSVMIVLLVSRVTFWPLINQNNGQGVPIQVVLSVLRYR